MSALRDQFESAWRRGERPRIEDQIQNLPLNDRRTAIEELIRTEVALRLSSGEVATEAEYLSRFPQFSESVAQAMSTGQIFGNETVGQMADSSPNASDPNAATNLNWKAETPKAASHEAAAASQTSVDPRAAIRPGCTFGRYRIEKELGRGGMGAVFLALDTDLDRPVAVKIPFFEKDDGSEVVDRFYREARSMATVRHPNLCPVFDVGLIDGQHFLTMAYIEGQSLSERLKVAPRLPFKQAAALLKKVALALGKAHQAGIVHRDLKPGNIMIDLDDEPIIMDFGLARRNKSGEVDLTQRGAVVGSPAYMSPEQVESRSDQIGPATDIWALGVILFQLVCGRRPFEGSIASIMGQVVFQEPPKPTTLFRDIPPEVDAVCFKAMSKEISQRYASAREFATALDAVLAARDLAFSPENAATEATQTFARSTTDSGTGSSKVSSGTGSSKLGANSATASMSRRRREAEVRQVTVAMFNFDPSQLSAPDAEAELEAQRVFLNFVSARVHRFGGMIVAGSGQEVSACFGFPLAYEDAAQRAIRAALEVMRDATQKPVPNLVPTDAMWAVIHTGEAVAEDTGTDAGISLIGDARNTTTRLDVVAEPGTIIISAATHQRVALYFECESLGVQRVRGMAQPIEIFKVIKESASRNRVELVDPGNLTPLVGRDTELTILKDRWEQALDGLGQIVLLIGDAGLGKSRLIRELREHVIGQDSENAAVIELRCSQHQQGTSLFPIIEFFSRLLDFENLTQADRLETIVRYLHELKLESKENVALLAGMLNVPTDSRYPTLELSPQKVKERTEDLLLRWLGQLVTVSPVLFIVEDLHWLDPSTLELMEKHVSQFETGRVLSLMTFRPEFETPWKSKQNQTQIALSRLTKRQIGEMMRKRTKRRDIPEVIVQQVIDRTDGIPLFIEEFTVVIVESGILDRTDEGASISSLLNVIPATLHDLLLARLDRMEADREVIQLASAIGREFSFELLAAACSLPEPELHAELEKLVKAEILFQKGQGADAVYIFKHALLQDAAYRSILTKKRQAYHQSISNALESHFPDIVNSQPALLAHHFTEAGVTDKAIQYWLKAGQKSSEQSANIEAIRHFHRGIELTMTLPESPQRDMLELGLKLPLSGVLMAVQGYAAPEVEPVQNRCIEICRKLGEGAPLFPVLAANWCLLFIRGRFADCYQRCPEVIKLAEAANGPGMIAEAYWCKNCTSFYAGDFISAASEAEIGVRHHHREASIEFAKITQQNSGPLNLAYHGMALWLLGFADQSFARHRESLCMAEDLKHIFTLQMTTWKFGQTYDLAGMGDKAIEYGGRVRRIAEEQGFAFWVALGMGCEGVGYKHLGRFDESIESLKAALAQLEATGSFILFPKYRGHLADSLWQTGQRDAALKQLDQAFADQSGGEYFMHAELLRLRGDFAFDRGELDAAESSYRESLAVALKQGAKMFELRTTLHLGRVWQKRGQTAEFRQQLEPLYNWFTEGFDMPDLQAAKALLTTL